MQNLRILVGCSIIVGGSRRRLILGGNSCVLILLGYSKQNAVPQLILGCSISNSRRLILGGCSCGLILVGYSCGLILVGCSIIVGGNSRRLILGGCSIIVGGYSCSITFNATTVVMVCDMNITDHRVLLRCWHWPRFHVCLNCGVDGGHIPWTTTVDSRWTTIDHV